MCGLVMLWVAGRGKGRATLGLGAPRFNSNLLISCLSLRCDGRGGEGR